MLCYDKAFKLLKEHGYSTYRIRQEKIIGENALTAMRNGGNINSKNIDILCRLLNWDKSAQQAFCDVLIF